MLFLIALFFPISSAPVECAEVLDVTAGGGPCAACLNPGQQCYQQGAQETTHGKCFKAQPGDVPSCALYCKSWVATAANVNGCLDNGKVPKADDTTTPLTGASDFQVKCCRTNNQLKNCDAAPHAFDSSATITKIFRYGQTLRQAYTALVSAGMSRLMASKIESCCHAGGMVASPDYSLHITIKHAAQGGHVKCQGSNAIYTAADNVNWVQNAPADWENKDVAGFQALFPNIVASSSTSEEAESFVSTVAFSINKHRYLLLFGGLFSLVAIIYNLFASNKRTLQVEFETRYTALL